jgi:hypothetical protein
MTEYLMTSPQPPIPDCRIRVQTNNYRVVDANAKQGGSGDRSRVYLNGALTIERKVIDALSQPAWVYVCTILAPSKAEQSQLSPERQKEIALFDLLAAGAE